MFARLQNLPAPDAVAPLPKRLRPISPTGARGVVLQDHVERDLVSRMAALEDFQRSDHSHRMRDTRDIVGKTDRIREDVGYLRTSINEIKRMKDELRVVKEEVQKARRDLKDRWHSERKDQKHETKQTSTSAPIWLKSKVEGVAKMQHEMKKTLERLERETRKPASAEDDVDHLVHAALTAYIESQAFEVYIEAHVKRVATGALTSAVEAAVDAEMERRLSVRNAKAKATREKNKSKQDEHEGPDDASCATESVCG